MRPKSSDAKYIATVLPWLVAMDHKNNHSKAHARQWTPQTKSSYPLTFLGRVKERYSPQIERDDRQNKAFLYNLVKSPRVPYRSMDDLRPGAQWKSSTSGQLFISFLCMCVRAPVWVDTCMGESVHVHIHVCVCRIQKTMAGVIPQVSCSYSCWDRVSTGMECAN